MKKILVTGSGGFVFSNFIRKALFNKSEYSFVSIDICKGPNVLNNIYANKGHKFYIGDVADKHFVDVIFELERPDIVIHGAASNSNDSQELIRSNILGTQVIVESCAKWAVDKLIYVSSDEVYGPHQSLPAVEESLLNPKNLQASTKLAGELFVKVAPKLNYNIVRLGYNYGPRQQMHNFVPMVVQSILSNKEIVIPSKSNHLKEWTHVEDSCAAIMTILEKGISTETYNITSGYEFSYLEVFNEICNIFDRGHDLIKFVETPSDQEYRYTTDACKLKLLGWKPNFKLKSGLYQTCSWYEKNPWFLRTS